MPCLVACLVACLAIAAWGGLTPAGGQTAPARPVVYRNLPVEIRTRDVPGAVRLTDGRDHVAYLLLITNWLEHEVRLSALEVIDGGSDRVIARFDSSALADPLRQRSTQFAQTTEPSAANAVLGAGRTALVNVQFALPAGSRLPATLRHRVRLGGDARLAVRRDDGEPSRELVVTSEPIRATTRAPVRIGPPLRGGPWRCGNGLAHDNAHATAYTFRSAALRVPQRYGCDFAKTDSAGNTLPNPFPDTINARMFYGYGAEVIAVADGEVVHVKDGIPENVPYVDGSVRMPVPLTNETVAGNAVVLRIETGVYAFFAHLQPGSIRVRPGQRVRRGAVLGLLGISGNAGGPHLHFHVGDSPVLNGSDPVPHVYDRLLFVGTRSVQGQPVVMRNTLPGDWALVRFSAP